MHWKIREQEMFDQITMRYFEKYLDTSLSDLKKGELRLCTSNRRCRPEKGWGYTFAIWGFVFHDRAVLSVRPDLEMPVQSIVTTLQPDYILGDAVQESILSDCKANLKVSSSYILSCSRETLQIHDREGCRKMMSVNVKSYITLKKFMWPALDETCETVDISRNISDGIAYAVFRDGRMVSASSAPAIAHMQEKVEEVGVDTHRDYRNLGYGRSVLSHMTKAILDLDRVPIYRLSNKNLASLRIAESVGYRKLADSVIFRVCHETENA
jgi:hypothetical protein